jgi:hypothetical protein
VAACPWCGSGEPEHRAPAKAFGSKSNKYLDAIAERIDLPVSTLIASKDTFECRNCGTAYCDPWLSQPATEWLFSLGYPQHHSGWLRFFAWLDRSPNYQKVYAPRAERIWAYLGNRLGTIAAYGEIGCPFTGLFTYFQELLQTPQESFARFEAHCAEQAKTAPQPIYVGRLQSLVRAANLAQRSDPRKICLLRKASTLATRPWALNSALRLAAVLRALRPRSADAHVHSITTRPS